MLVNFGNIQYGRPIFQHVRLHSLTYLYTIAIKHNNKKPENEQQKTIFHDLNDLPTMYVRINGAKTTTC